MTAPPTTSPFIHGDNSVTRVMRQVIYALIPGIICATWFFGWGVLINIVVASITALVTEFVMLKLRDRPAKPFLSDLSALVTAFLLAICLPSFLPWWMVVVGTTFAIVIAKHLYGGLGNNPFNPAMIGYVVLLISFPQQMTQWVDAKTIGSQSISLQRSLAISFEGARTLDGISGATKLDHVKTEIKRGAALPDVAANLPEVKVADRKSVV